MRLLFVVGTLAALWAATGTAHAVPPLVDGKTSAVYDYTEAIRERVFIPQPGIDTDGNGVMDWVTADVIRPNTAEKVPAIVYSSYHLTTFCQNRTDLECMADWDDDGVNDRWARFYDNYFVPRGYAYVLAQTTGTGYTEHGCPLWFGPTDVAGQKSIIDWLNGRVPGYTAADVNAAPKVASWHSGSSAMVGGSGEAMFPNAVAATGVDGLKTIVTEHGMSNAYNHFHMGGLLYSDVPQALNRVAIHLDQITQGNLPNPPGVNLPSRRDLCMFTRQFILNDANTDLGDGDAHGDINTFWRERDWVKDAHHVKAAVFTLHGIDNDTVRLDQLSVWWDALKANGVPRKLWLARGGNVPAFDLRRAAWVDTLHRWLDHWLYGVPNGIMSEPPVSIEEAKDVWRDYPDWPVPGARDADLYLRAGAVADAAGTLGATSGGWRDTLGYTTASTLEDAYIADPTGAQTDRRVFLSPPLTRDMRLSGTPVVDLRAALGATQTNLGVIVADYGAGTQVGRTAATPLTTRSCWGASNAGDPCSPLGSACTLPPSTVEHACYPDTTRPTVDVAEWRVTRGVLDSSNRDSLWFQDATPVVPGQAYRFRFPTVPVEYTVRAGHRLAVILTGHQASRSGPTGTLNVPVTVDTRTSKVTLPVVGGYEALAAAGAFDDPTSSVGGVVPPTLALSLGAPASFGAFVPGVAREYTASMTASIVSTAGDAALSASEPGHLTNGAFALPQPLQVSFSNSTWAAPASNEAVTVSFKQAIGAGDALRTGVYSRTLTFTLSTTTP